VRELGFGRRRGTVHRGWGRRQGTAAATMNWVFNLEQLWMQ
jgi:hypothetical protein